SGFPSRAEQLIDVALAIGDMNASSRITQELRRLLDVLQPSNAFLLLDGHPRRIDLLLERGSPFELLPRPEFDRRQSKGQTSGRNCEARVHQDAANSVRSHAAHLVPPAVDGLGDADRGDILSLIAELRGVMEHENQTVDGARAITRRLEMTGQN